MLERVVDRGEAGPDILGCERLERVSVEEVGVWWWWGKMAVNAVWCCDE